MTELYAHSFQPRYILTHEPVALPDGETREVFGIAAVSDGTSVDSVSDLDCDEAFVSGLVARLNEGHVVLCHFRDILEDEIVGRY
jgi:hypothetical protein